MARYQYYPVGVGYIHLAIHQDILAYSGMKIELLIAGDAFVTTKAESALSTALQKKQVSGPPAYATTDWVAAYKSVEKLLLLQPEIAATGHGQPMHGTEMLRQLLDLYEHFDEKGIPDHGRYVKEAAVQDANGVLYVPPMTPEDNYKKWIYITSAAFFAASVILTYNKEKEETIFYKKINNSIV